MFKYQIIFYVSFNNTYKENLIALIYALKFTRRESIIPILC